MIFLRIVLAIRMLLQHYPAWAIRGLRPNFLPIEESVAEYICSVANPDFAAVLAANLEEVDLVQRTEFRNSESVFIKFGLFHFDQTREQTFAAEYEGVPIVIAMRLRDQNTWVEVHVTNGRLFSFRFACDVEELKKTAEVEFLTAKGPAVDQGS